MLVFIFVSYCILGLLGTFVNTYLWGILLGEDPDFFNEWSKSHKRFILLTYPIWAIMSILGALIDFIIGMYLLLHWVWKTIK